MSELAISPTTSSSSSTRNHKNAKKKIQDTDLEHEQEHEEDEYDEEDEDTEFSSSSSDSSPSPSSSSTNKSLKNSHSSHSLAETVTLVPPLPSSLNDPTMKLSRERVAAAKADTSGRVYVVYCDGVFDLFHLAHMRMFEQAKCALGDPKKVFLIAGVCSDELVHQYKGKTVMNHKLRCESVKHCKWVDQVNEDAPWVLTDEYLAQYKIDFVAHDAIPYKDTSGSAGNSNDVYGHIKERGMFLETLRTEGLSTSDIIVQIIRDYDEYVLRNLDRGYTKEDLNVGKTWQIRANMHEKQRKVKASSDKMKEEFKLTEVAWLNFIREFNPRHHQRELDRMRAEHKDGEESPSNMYNANPRFFSAREYANHLKQKLPERSSGLWHHTCGLSWSILQLVGYTLSYANPFSYLHLPQSQLKKKDE